MGFDIYANLDPSHTNLDPNTSDWWKDAQNIASQWGVSGFGDAWRNGAWRPGLYPGFNNDTSNWLSEKLKNWQAAADPGGWEDSVKNFASNPGNALWALTTGQTGGMTGAQAATGGDVGKGVLTDVAGLGAGAGLAQALPALGLSTPAATAASGGTGGAVSGEASGGGSMWDWLDNLDTGSFDPGGEGMYQAPSPDVGSFDPGGEGLYNDPNYGGMDFGSFDPGGEGVFTGNGSVFNGQNPLWGQLAKYGSKLLNPLLAAAGGRAGAGGTRSGGGSSLGDMAFNSTPFLLSAALANSQRNDINPYLDRLNSLSDRFAGNESPYLKSLTDPYDMSTNRGRGDLTMRLGDRGVLGSSFGNADLGNFDYMRDVGRGNLVSQAINQSVGAQSQLTDQAIKGVNTRNAGTNALLGAGLNASSRLFSPQQDPFGIQQILKMAGANG